jgi:hypothetical protein
MSSELTAGILHWTAAPPSPSQRAAWQQVVEWLIGESRVSSYSALCRPQLGAEGDNVSERRSSGDLGTQGAHNDTDIAT